MPPTMGKQQTPGVGGAADPDEERLKVLIEGFASNGDKEGLDMAMATLYKHQQSKRAASAPPRAPAPTSPPPVNPAQAVTRPAPRVDLHDLQEPEPPGLFRRMRDRFDSAVGMTARAYGLTPDDLPPPTDEEEERENKYEAFVSRAINSAGLGAPDVLINKLSGGEELPPGYPTRAQQLQGDHPGYSFAGNLTGAVGGGIAGGGRLVGEVLKRGIAKVAPGAAPRITRALTDKVVRRAVPKMSAKTAGKLGETGTQMIAGAGTAAAETAVQNLIEGASPLENMGLPLAFGGGLPLLGRGIEQLSRIPRINRWVDRYRRGVEQGDYLPPQKPAVDPVSAVDPGPVDPGHVDPQAKTELLEPVARDPKRRGSMAPKAAAPGAEEGQFVMGQPVSSGREAADQAVPRFVKRRNELIRQNRGRLNEKQNPRLDDAVLDRKAMRKDILERIKANVDEDGFTKDPRLHEALTEELNRIPAPLSVTGGGRMVAKPPMRLRTAIDRQKAIKREADWPNPSPSDPAKRARLKGSHYKRAIERDAPDIARARAEAAEEARQLEKDQDSVFRTEADVSRGDRPASLADDFEADDLVETSVDENLSALLAAARKQAAENATATQGAPDLRVAKELAGSDFFNRVGDKTVPGRRLEGYHKRLEGRDPRTPRFDADMKELPPAADTTDTYDRIIDFVRAAKARDATKFSLSSEVETVLPKLLAFGGPTGAQLLRWFGGRVAEPGLRRSGEAIGRLPAGRMVPFLRNPLDAIEESRRKKEEKKKNASQ